MEIKLLCGVLCLLLVWCIPLAGLAAPVNAGLPGVSEPMLQAAYWIERTPSARQVILSPAEIVTFNRSIYAAMPQTVVDLARIPDAIDKTTLRKWLASDKLPRGLERYEDGKPVTSAFYDQLEQNMNLQGVQELNPVSWGFTVRRTDIRTFPTNTASSDDDDSDDFDWFQETAVNISEPVAVLHRSRDAAWLFIQMYNYRGWVRAEDVALSTNRQTWQAKLDPASVLIITGSKVVPRDSVNGRPVAEWRAGMGTRLTFLGKEQDGFAVEIPHRGANGLLVWRRAWIHGKADVSVGFLPYTQANILRQAFKMLGENYGWGGLHEGRDCSSFIMDIYNVFGIRAPRNADQQEKVPGRRIALAGIADSSTRYRLLGQAEPGATLHLHNHVMLYLGQDGGKHYAIHNLGSYGDVANPRADGTLPRVEVMKVVVGGLDVSLRSGRHFIDVLSSANIWHP
jgi:hypothetical protein